MRDSSTQFSNLINEDDPDAITGEIVEIIEMVFPRFDFGPSMEACEDVARLFRGDYPGFHHCNLVYHDLHHTMLVTLAMARLMHGAVVEGHQLTEEDFNLGLISALMHDTGYIQRSDDLEGTGAKYTLVHIDRSIDFVEEYYRNNPRPGVQQQFFRDILFCTGFSTKIGEIHFPDERVALLGKMMGTADLLGQMADRCYLEKLHHLYDEFVEGGITEFTSPLDLLEKTREFHQMTLKRFAGELGGVNRFARHHFRKRWGIDEDLYEKAIDANMVYLNDLVSRLREDYRGGLRRTLPGAGIQETLPGGRISLETKPAKYGAGKIPEAARGAGR